MVLNASSQPSRELHTRDVDGGPASMLYWL
jgi:hypothetical protein